MPTIRLVPSTLNNAAGTNYLNISNSDNALTNTDSTNYATITNTNASTSNRYIYLKGFNFNSVPSGAVVSDWTVKIKGYYTSGYSSSMYLCNNTTTQSNATASSFTTSTATRTFAKGSLTWDSIKSMGTNGADFGIRINCRRSSRNTQAIYYIYGAEIEVTYTVPVYHDITITNNTSATVTADETHPLEGTDVVLFTDTLSGITITDNNTDITNQFTQASGDTISATPGSSFTTGFSQSGANFYQNSSTTSTAWLEYAIGHSAESPYSTSNTSNTYVKPEGATGWINYQFDFSDIPTSATINSVSVKVYGARENSTVDSTHVARFQCYSGSTAKGTLQNFTSTSNGSVTVSDIGTWTATELHSAQLRFEIGYYGGRMLGITWTVTYTLQGYVYTITNVVADHTIVVSSGGGPVIYFKDNGSWVQAAEVYKKVNGSWVKQTDLTNVFTSGTNYVKG